MIQRERQWLCLMLAVLLSLSLCVPAAAVDDSVLSCAVSGSAQYVLNTVSAPRVSSIGGEWAVIGLARSGHDVPQTYWDSYYSAAADYVEDCGGVLHEKKYTEYSRLIIALTAIGADPANVAGYNLLTALGDYDKTILQGLNGPIWALIALDSGDYDMPINPQARTQATRQMYIDRILSCRLDDGGWSLTGNGTSDPDVTGMALQALAKYREQSAVQKAVEAALVCMSAMQDADGGFSSWGTANSESCVQMLVALCELGIPLDDARFVKNGKTVLDALLSYRQTDGSFLHTAGGSDSSQMASEQGLYALAAAWRAEQGYNSLYRMNDVTISVSESGSTAVGLPNKHTDVKQVPITAPGATFNDIAAHQNQSAIEAMAARGIINGRGDGSFDPEATMTRAEFSAIVVRALGLTPKTTSVFTDVAADRWYAPYVGTASGYGLINGRGGALFDPEGTITRQEAAALVARAASLCGMNTQLEKDETLNTLSQLSDSAAVAEWARESMAFCYQENILPQSDLNAEPLRAIRRCEIAQMLYNLLGRADLL